MGKLIAFLTMLIVLDILFLITGQLNLESPSSVIATAITNPQDLKNSNFWAVLITGLSGLSVAAGIVAGLVTRSSDIAIFFTMAGTLSLLVFDYISIFSYLYNINEILATIILIPVILIFTMVIIEWGRGKD